MRVLIGMLCVACAVGQDAAQDPQLSDPKLSGPTTLVIQYRCTPAARPHLRQMMLQSGIGRFQNLRDQGVFTSYRILFSRYADTNNWDMLGLLNFSSYTNFTAWKKIERANPGGLNPDAAALITAINTYPADRMRGKGTPEALPDPVFLVVPYTFSVSTPAYLKYADDYVMPQFDGWMAEGVLSGYDMFLQRYSASRPWDSLIILEYKNDESLGARERVVAKVRQQLQSNAVWRAVSENKQSIRVEKEPVVADELVVRR